MSSRDGFRLRCDTHGGLPHARSYDTQRLVDFFLEHDLYRLQYPLTQPKLDELRYSLTDSFDMVVGFFMA